MNYAYCEFIKVNPPFEKREKSPYEKQKTQFYCEVLYSFIIVKLLIFPSDPRLFRQEILVIRLNESYKISLPLLKWGNEFIGVEKL